MKSILHYFKLAKTSEKDVSLPNPYGPLSNKVPSGAIEAANDRVENFSHHQPYQVQLNQQLET